MKPIKTQILFVLLLALTPSLYSEAKEDRGHTLTGLWNNYQAAVDRDRPDEQKGILIEIKKKAFDNHLPWDFYEACDEYAYVCSRTNWKLRDVIMEQKESELMAFDEPVIDFLVQRGKKEFNLEEFLASNRDRLKKAYNPGFYWNIFPLSESAFKDALIPLIKNDFDFILWSAFLNGRKNVTSVEITGRLIKDRYENEYPFCGLIDYTLIKSLSEKKDLRQKYSEFVEKYDGKAVSLLGREEILILDYGQLSFENSNDEAGFEKFKSDCEQFYSDKGNYRRLEKTIVDCCKSLDRYYKLVLKKEIHFYIENGHLRVFARNLDSVHFEIKKKNLLIYDTVLIDTKRRFCVYDTLACELPSFPDGEYQAICSTGDVSYESDLCISSLSIASRQDSDGIAIYVADSKSGKPVSSADITVRNGNDDIIYSINKLPLDGFTHIPKDMQNVIRSTKRGATISARASVDGDILLSSSLKLRFDDWQEKRRDNHLSSKETRILTDRGAYNPDDTVHFKVILYSRQDDPHVIADAPLTATLTDSKGNIIDNLSLITGEFGSASGQFVLKRQEKNGTYRINILDETGKSLGRRNLRVDDYVLSSIGLEWEDSRQFYFPGDSVFISGKVISNSGNSLSSAKIDYSIELYDDPLEKGILSPADDGSFQIAFKTGERHHSRYYIIAKVSDGTGETNEFATLIRSRDKIPLWISLMNSEKGQVSLEKSEYDGYCSILSEEIAELTIDTKEWGSGPTLTRPDLKINYEVLYNGDTIVSGSASPGKTFPIDLTGRESGIYVVSATASSSNSEGLEFVDTKKLFILKIKDSDTVLPHGVRDFYMETDNDIGIRLGHGSSPVWAEAELFGTKGELLERQSMPLRANGIGAINFPYKDNYPDAVFLHVFYFYDNQSSEYFRNVCRGKEKLDLPLSFNRFKDTTSPGTSYTFTINTLPEIECAAVIFDISTESISSNTWGNITPSETYPHHVNYHDVCGTNVAGYYEEEAIPFQLASRAVNTTPYIRQYFANTVAWEPSLLSDKDGKIDLRFTTSDKLSTYCVQLFAHRKDLHNATLRKEMTVTLPVNISVAQPRILRTGDQYNLLATLSNNSDENVDGMIVVSFLDGDSADNSPVISSIDKHISVPAGKSIPMAFPVSIGNLDKLGIRIIFTADAGHCSDGIFVSVPVVKAEQEISEAHSGILHDGQDKDGLVEALRSRFINADGSQASAREISIIDLIRESLSQEPETGSSNSISLVNALYSRFLLSRINGQDYTADMDIIDRIAACQNRDGGFAWFAGMKSSSATTAFILERFASMEELQKHIRIEDAVRFIDQDHLNKTQHGYENLSPGQYLYVRSMFPDISVDLNGYDKQTVGEFQKANRAYLTPRGPRGLNWRILEKARRLKSLCALIDNPSGNSLAHSLGLASTRELKPSKEADIASLIGYAQAHSSGGIYFPNAVLPFRGLLESELYAHTLLCNLLSECGYDDIADSVRLWIMVQKETQEWGTDPAYVEAVASVLEGSQKVLNTKLLVLSASATLSLDAIKETGNGFKVECRYFANGKEISEGDSLSVGDKVTAKYSVWNDENRSYVRLTAPRNASLLPVNQISGNRHYGYRNVLVDRTEFWFDVLPEGNVVIEEDCFVTQSGCFQSPAPIVESLYAPHYRANGTHTVMNTE